MPRLAESGVSCRGKQQLCLGETGETKWGQALVVPMELMQKQKNESREDATMQKVKPSEALVNPLPCQGAQLAGLTPEPTEAEAAPSTPLGHLPQGSSSPELCPRAPSNWHWH